MKKLQCKHRLTFNIIIDTGDLLTSEAGEAAGQVQEAPPNQNTHAPNGAGGAAAQKQEKEGTKQKRDERSRGSREGGQHISPYAQMLNDAIKESKDPEVAKTKEAIDAVRKERAEVIGKVKEARRRLTYKEAEDAALKRLLDIEKAKPEAAEKRRKIGYLKRMKNKLEFRISTEASSLADEKGLVRQIEDVNKQLSEA